MNELVHWILHSRSLCSARLPSVVGSGLPERMRSTAFALLGLTAAAGLALVAIFAQLGFPLLEPAPLPAEPTASESIAAAEKVAPARPPLTLRSTQPVRPAPSPRRGEGLPGAKGSPVAEVPAVGGPGGAAPAPSGGNENGVGGAGGEPGGSNSAPTDAPEPAAPTVTAPAPTAPAPTAPVPKPADPPPAPPAAASAPEPVAPGNSSSAAAAAHASERGIEASSGNGYAEGLDK
jgi:hypothetical protein